MSQSNSSQLQNLLPQLPAEVRSLISALLEENRRLQETVGRQQVEIEELRRRLNQTPRNSSKPPSSQHPHSKPKPNPNPKRKRSGKKPGGQPGHKKAQRTLIPSDDCNDIQRLKPNRCRRCGEELFGEDSQPLRHQVWELPEIRPVVVEYQRHRLICPCCHTQTCAALPEGVPAGQSGPRLVAFTSLLMAYFRQSRRRTSQFFETLLNIPCSDGLTVKHQDRVTESLAETYQELKASVPQQPAVHLDETGTKEAGRKGWVWVAASKLFTVFAVRLSRKKSVVRELLGEDYAGVLTTDRYAGYNGYDRRQLCWAHLLRDFQALIDAGHAGKRIGRRLKNIAMELFDWWQRYRDGTIGRRKMRKEIDWLKQPFWDALESGMRCRHGPTVTLCCDLFERFDQLWMFLEHIDVEPTNNAAERALRHCVIWRKLSFGTQSSGGSRFVETMLSVIETCRQQDRSVFAFLTEAVQAHFSGQRPPSLLPTA